jgi:hypothetical protein
MREPAEFYDQSFLALPSGTDLRNLRNYAEWIIEFWQKEIYFKA